MTSLRTPQRMTSGESDSDEADSSFAATPEINSLHPLMNSLTGLEDSSIRRLSRVSGVSSSTIGNVSETCKV